MRQLTPPITDFLVQQEPFYLPSANEVEIFEAAWRSQIPVMLKGPTGCGKTRFVSYMAHRLARPVVTVACHDDLTASDLVGRYLLQADETVWMDGPLTAAVRHGAILYLDEVVEARRDTLVVIHPLTDTRRILPIDKLGVLLKADDQFMVVVSYNPGYQSALKELKPSTRQRFIGMNFGYPAPEVEAEVVASESGGSKTIATQLVEAALRIRNLTERGLEEGVSTRLLIYAASLIHAGVEPKEACFSAFSRALTDDYDLGRSIEEIITDFF